MNQNYKSGMPSTFAASKDELFYNSIYAYTGLALCICGLVLNVFNIIVFTRKNMISPINTIFFYLAVADFFILLFFIPMLWYDILSSGPFFMDYDSFGGKIFTDFYSQICLFFVDVSTWLTVAMSAFRMISIAYPFQSCSWCSLKSVRVVVKVILIGSFIFEFIHYLFNVFRTAEDYKGEVFATWITSGDLNVTRMVEYEKSVYVVTTGVVFRIIPSILIALFSSRLAVMLLRMRKQRQAMAADLAVNTNATRDENQIIQTTLILLILSVLSLITLVPRGLAYLCSTVDGNLFRRIRFDVRKMLVMLVLINSNFPFIVYYTIGTNFRRTFIAIFRRNHHLEEHASDAVDTCTVNN